jgi:hypothetical protein
MSNFKKRRCSNVEVDVDVTEESSYCKMKARLEKKEVELEQVCVRLQLTEQRKMEVETYFDQAIKVLHDTIRSTERRPCSGIGGSAQRTGSGNRTLKSRMVMCRLRIERLMTSVLDGSDAYDHMAAKVAFLEQTIEEANNEKAKHNVKIKVAERAALRHFGLLKTTVNPVLFRAAVGFCSGCTNVVEEGEESKDRKYNPQGNLAAVNVRMFVFRER